MSDRSCSFIPVTFKIVTVNPQHYTQLTFTCSKLPIETLKKDVKHIQS